MSDSVQVLVSMMLSSDYKAPGGKLVRVRLSEQKGMIEGIEITGDFFLLPEDGLSKLEELLTGHPLEEDAVRSVVYDFFIETGSQGLGVSRDDFVNAIISSRREDGKS